MELGALVCTPRNPQCGICPVRKLCVAFRTNCVDELPNLGKREKATTRRFIAFVVERDGRFLVRQRPAGIVNAHLWEFPNVEVGARLSVPRQRPKFKAYPASSALVLAKLLRVRDPRSIKLSPLATIKHSITRYRITLETFMASVKRPPPRTPGVWRTPAQMSRLAFTAAHKRLATLAASRILSSP